MTPTEIFKEWADETQFLSSNTEIINHPNVPKIINYGHYNIKFLFEQMKEYPLHSMLCLQEIVGYSPVKPSNRGKIKEMLKDWVVWGIEADYINALKFL